MRKAANSSKPLAIAYVDGLNLQRQVQKAGANQWIDVRKLCELMLPNYEFVQIRYFTTKLKAFPGNQDAAIEQEIYWRALRTLEPSITFHFGTMRSSVRLYPSHPLTNDGTDKWKRVKIWYTEEKGSDVALASFMVADAALEPEKLQVLVSNDSDFAPTLQLLRTKFNSRIALLSPSQQISNALIKANPSLVRNIRTKTVASAQFPLVLEDQDGTFHAPANWR